MVRLSSLTLLSLTAGLALAPPQVASAQNKTKGEMELESDIQDMRNRRDEAARAQKRLDDIHADAAAAAARLDTSKYVAGIRFQNVRHEWSVRDWKIVALPDHECDALLQKRSMTPFNFWGFRVKNGSDAQMYFGSVANAKPQPVQITYNDGPPNSYAAGVVQFSDWSGYVVPIKMVDLWALPDELSFEAFVGGAKVTWGTTRLMGKVAEVLEQCDNWQDAH